jgi:hypothetical protein
VVRPGGLIDPGGAGIPIHAQLRHNRESPSTDPQPGVLLVGAPMQAAQAGVLALSQLAARVGPSGQGREGSVALTTSLAGRVRNTTLPKSHALLPLLEAVVNGLQAIDARGDEIGHGRLTVTIEPSAQEAFDFDSSGPGRVPLKPIVGFVVEDNGVGFTPDNMSSFETLDTDFKDSLGCRGVGRLLWLKAFDKVSVRSAYWAENGTPRPAAV